MSTIVIKNVFKINFQINVIIYGICCTIVVIIIFMNMINNTEDDGIVIAEEANILIQGLRKSFDRNERASSWSNMQLFVTIRNRVRRRLWPFIGERIIHDVPSREYGAAVILGLDMPLPPSGPADDFDDEV